MSNSVNDYLNVQTIFLFTDVKGFPSSDSLLHYYASHHNNTVIAIIFDDADQKNLNYIMRIHQDYYSTDINTAELYKRSFNFEPGIGKVCFIFDQSTLINFLYVCLQLSEMFII